MKKVSLIFTAAFLMSAATFAQSGLVLKKGQKFSVETKVTTVSNTEAMGQTMETNLNSTTNFQIEVDDVNPTNYKLKSTVSRILMSMSMMGQEMKVDTDKKEDLDGPLGSGLKGVVNTPHTVLFDKSGHLVAPEKPKEGSGSNPMMEQFANLDETGYGAESAFLALPADLKVGSTWNLEKNTKDSKNKFTFVVKELKGDVAVLTITGTISSEMTIEQNGMEIVTKTSGKITGEASVNYKSGVLQSSTTTADVSGNVEVMGQELPTSAKTTTVTTVKEL